MFLIEKALEFWVIEHSIKEVVNWKRFPFYTQELSKLTNAYFQPGLYKYEVGKSEPQWTSEAMLGGHETTRSNLSKCCIILSLVQRVWDY